MHRAPTEIWIPINLREQWYINDTIRISMFCTPNQGIAAILVDHFRATVSIKFYQRKFFLVTSDACRHEGDFQSASHYSTINRVRIQTVAPHKTREHTNSR